MSEPQPTHRHFGTNVQYPLRAFGSDIRNLRAGLAEGIPPVPQSVEITQRTVAKAYHNGCTVQALLRLTSYLFSPNYINGFLAI
jgi:hypothetical protein